MSWDDSFTAEQLAEIESEWIRACAFRFDGEKYRSEKWSKEKSEEASRLVASGGVFDQAADNMALLFGLTRNFEGETGPCRSQISAERNSARMLFLEVCGKPVPAEFRSRVGVAEWESSFKKNLRVGKSLVRTRLVESKNTNLKKIRTMVAHGEDPPKLIYDSPYAEVCRQYRTLEWMPYDFEKESVQNALIRYYKESGYPVIEEEFAAAKRSARAFLFDFAARITLGEDVEGSELDLEWAFARSRIISGPMAARNDDRCVDTLFDRMSGPEGWRYAQDLSNELKKAEERCFRVKFDRHDLVLAKHWVNPDCPLWLMTKPAISSACRAFSKYGQWSDERIKRRLRKGFLERCSRYPINEVNISRGEGGKDDWKVAGFEIQKAVYESLSKEEISEFVLIRSAK